MTFNFTPIIEALIALCAVVITVVVIPYVKAKYSSESLGNFISWVKIGVAAAEQLYLQTEGEQKKQYVLNFLEEKGYKVDEAQVEKAIEAAVLQLHNALYGGAYERSEE